MDIPLEQRIPQRPMAARPQRPEPGGRVQVLWYTVECRLCSCHAQPQYFVRNVAGELLSLSMQCHDPVDAWDRMCHILGWYPLPGLEHLARIPAGWRPDGAPAPVIAPVVCDAPRAGGPQPGKERAPCDAGRKPKAAAGGQKPAAAASASPGATSSPTTLSLFGDE